MKPSTVRILRWLPAVALMTMIFLLSSQPGGESGNLSRLVLEFFASIGLDLRFWFGDNAFLVIRKMAHFAEYALLYSLMVLALGNFMKNKWWALLWTVLYAASDEFHQLFVPGRVGNFGDVLVDSAGALTMLGFLYLVNHFRKKRTNARVSAEEGIAGQ